MATNIVLFVSEEKLKTFTSINFNLDPNDLRPFVITAQDMYLRNYLGSTFYKEIKAEVVLGSISANNTILLDEYISSAVVNYALYLALPFLKYKLLNKGVLSATAENATAAGLDELKYLRSEVLKSAEFYMAQMQDHIQRNLSNYPTYSANVSTDGEPHDSTTPYFSGIHIPKGKNYCPNV